MRNLQTQDIFAFVRMIDEVGIKDQLKELVMSKDNIAELTAESFGYDLLFTLLEGASKKKAEESIYEFFSNIMECPKDDIRQMEPTEFLENVLKIADVEKWKSFFTSAAKLMK
jgi:hypothetical protein